MTPIHELLNRMRWDQEFAKAEFELGYFDRVEDRIVRRTLAEIFFQKNDHFDFYFVDEDGVEHSVPLHRIKEVYRNGELIWRRDV